MVQAGTPGYDFMRIARVTYRGWPTADWEYRAGSAPTRTHTLIRSTVPDPKRVFDLSWTCSDETWTEDKAFFDTFTSTFDPRS